MSICFLEKLCISKWKVNLTFAEHDDTIMESKLSVSGEKHEKQAGRDTKTARRHAGTAGGRP
jgi:hypothetical protein